MTRLERYQREAPMKQYSLTEARNTYAGDYYWLQNAGFLDKDGNLTKFFYEFMKGNLKLPIDAEINIQRRIERFMELSGWIDYLKSDKAKFRS